MLIVVENEIIGGAANSLSGIVHLPDHWIRHLVNWSTKFVVQDTITLNQLSAGVQLDSVSCGLFALNSIAHHYLGHTILPSDQIVLVCHQIEIALDIISSMTVYVFFIL